ncbi:hypothetical protein [Verrucomicrobium spinosum]|uniref:hypothetical protein n=1 Tax=Verrucomicrobium spinosum TaxID=2736 RepID=UPI0012E317F8|nr:hypothetical protein [Verrucomicrobium spinosum]
MSQLEYDCRKDVERWLSMFCKVQQAVATGMGIVAARESVAKANGIPVSTFNRKWFDWQDHGWEKLINRAKWPVHREAGLPPAFRDFVQSMYFAHQRGQTGREVHRKVVAQWRKWRAGDVTMQILDTTAHRSRRCTRDCQRDGARRISPGSSRASSA